MDNLAKDLDFYKVNIGSYKDNIVKAIKAFFDCPIIKKKEITITNGNEFNTFMEDDFKKDSFEKIVSAVLKPYTLFTCIACFDLRDIERMSLSGINAPSISNDTKVMARCFSPFRDEDTKKVIRYIEDHVNN